MKGIEISIKSDKEIITSFEEGKEIKIEISIKNKTEQKIEAELEYEINPILKKISKLDEYEKKIIVESQKTEEIRFTLKSIAQDEISESCDMPFFLGKLAVKINNQICEVTIPTAKIIPTDSLWEEECCEYFRSSTRRLCSSGAP